MMALSLHVMPMTGQRGAKPPASRKLPSGSRGQSPVAQEYELAYVRSSDHAQAALAEQYAGLPL